MSFLMRQVAHCDVCGHEWLTKKVPIHCAKCKSRKWNQDTLPTERVGEIMREIAARQVAPERTVEYEE